jgi:hypothetical protein
MAPPSLPTAMPHALGYACVCLDGHCDVPKSAVLATQVAEFGNDTDPLHVTGWRSIWVNWPWEDGPVRTHPFRRMATLHHSVPPQYLRHNMAVDTVPMRVPEPDPRAGDILPALVREHCV